LALYRNQKNIMKKLKKLIIANVTERKALEYAQRIAENPHLKAAAASFITKHTCAHLTKPTTRHATLYRFWCEVTAATAWRDLRPANRKRALYLLEHRSELFELAAQTDNN
jgi:predicted HD phosphohydrolase